MVYVGSADHDIYAVDAATGALVWTYVTRGPVLTSPAVANGVVFVSSEGGRLYALDASSGGRKWSYYFTRLESSPAVADGMVYVGSYDLEAFGLR
jgi:outer membrane protein assembly factor BamB